MRTKYSRIAAAILAVTAGGLAAFALRPATGSGTSTLAARNPAVEVRTQVIRRTIHIIKHEPGARLPGSRGSAGLVVAGHGRARTGASGGHASAHAAGSTAAVATRSSGSHSAASSSTASGTAAPVTTRSSGSHSTASAGHSSGTAAPVATRSSGSHGSPASGTASRPVTRSSGGGHGHGEDGGDGGGGDN